MDYCVLVRFNLNPGSTYNNFKGPSAESLINSLRFTVLLLIKFQFQFRLNVEPFKSSQLMSSKPTYSDTNDN